MVNKKPLTPEEERLLKKSEKQSNDFKKQLNEFSNDLKHHKEHSNDGKTDAPSDG